MRRHSAGVLIGPCSLILASALVSCGAAPSATPSAAVDGPAGNAVTDRRARSLDLIVPEATGDPASLDDAALDAAIDAANRRVNELTGESLRQAAAYSGSDLGRDAGYRRLLLAMKAAETELGRLEMERDRRVRAR